MRLEDYATRYENLRMSRTDGVLEVTMHTRGGEALWGVTDQSLHGELGDAFLDIGRDPENKVVILTGTGKTFIAGMDPQTRAPESSAAALWSRLYREGVAMLENLLAIPVPVIAAVNGPALIHAELAMLSDIVLAADHAEFADIAHVPRGVVPGDGVQSVWLMLLGPNRGRYFLLTGERIPAEEARRLGIVAEVLPGDALLSRAHEIAADLAKNSRQMLVHTRRVLVRSLRRRLSDELEMGLAVEALTQLSR